MGKNQNYLYCPLVPSIPMVSIFPYQLWRTQILPWRDHEASSTRW